MLSILLVTFAGIAFVANVVYNRFLHPLARVPGPWLASITPLWLVWQCMKNRRPSLDLQLHEKYGSVVRITPDEVIFSNPKYFKTIYGAGSARNWPKSRYLTEHNRDQDNWERLNLLNEVDMDKMRVQRRMFGPVYSTANAVRHETQVDDVIQLWDTRLRSKAGTILDIYSELERLNIDMYSKITFGKAYGAVAKGSDDGHMHSMAQFWQQIGWIGFVPWWCSLQYTLRDWKLPYSGGKLNLPVTIWAVGAMGHIENMAAGSDKWTTTETAPKLRHGFLALASERPGQPASIKATVEKAVKFDEKIYGLTEDPSTDVAGEDGADEAMASPTRGCIYDDLRLLHKTKSKFRSTWKSSIALTNLGAGIDTTSWTLAAFLAGVCGTPAAYTKLQEELDEAVTDGRLERNASVPHSVAIALPHLQACLYETMRIWPNVAVSLGRIVPRTGITIDDYFIPAGYVVGMNSKKLGMDEGIFGQHTTEFHPERWLTKDIAQLHDMKTRNLAFGGDSRRCPGQHIAWVGMSKILAHLFLNYDVEVLNSMNGPAGPGGQTWIEVGTFPTRWEGMEARVKAR